MERVPFEKHCLMCDAPIVVWRPATWLGWLTAVLPWLQAGMFCDACVA